MVDEQPVTVEPVSNGVKGGHVAEYDVQPEAIQPADPHYTPEPPI